MLVKPFYKGSSYFSTIFDILIIKYNLASLLAKLKEISQDADLSSEQKEELNFLIAELEKMKSPLDIAKEIIDEYCREEFERDEGADYTNLSEVNVAYTTTEDDKHEIQANVNLVDFKIETDRKSVV